jgi:hypothetical protein
VILVLTSEYGWKIALAISEAEISWRSHWQDCIPSAEPGDVIQIDIHVLLVICRVSVCAFYEALSNH